MTTPENPGGTVLTDEERNHLRAEVLFREELRREITNSSVAPRKNGLRDFWKSPALATIFGGLLLNLFGVVSAHYQRRQVRDQMLLERQVAVSSSFVQDIETSVSIRLSLLKNYFWLTDEKNKRDDARNEIGLPRAEIQKVYLDLWKAYMQAKKPHAVLDELRLSFRSKEVHRLVDLDDKALGDVFVTDNVSDMRTRANAESKLHDQLRDAVRSEISQQSQ